MENVFQKTNKQCTKFNTEFKNISYDGEIAWKCKSLFVYYEELRGLAQSYTQLIFTIEGGLPNHLQDFKDNRAKELVREMSRVLGFLKRFNKERNYVTDLTLTNMTKDQEAEIKEMEETDTKTWENYLKFVKSMKMEELLNEWCVWLDKECIGSEKYNKVLQARCKDLKIFFNEDFTFISFINERVRETKVTTKVNRKSWELVEKMIRMTDTLTKAPKTSTEELYRCLGLANLYHLRDMDSLFRDESLMYFIDLIEFNLGVRQRSQRKTNIKYPITSMGMETLDEGDFNVDLLKGVLTWKNRLNLKISCVSQENHDLSKHGWASHFCFVEPTTVANITKFGKLISKDLLKNGGFVYLDEESNIITLYELTEGSYWAFEGPYVVDNISEEQKQLFYDLPKDVFGNSPLKRSLWCPPSEFSFKDQGTFICELKLGKKVVYEAWKLINDSKGKHKKYKADLKTGLLRENVEYLEKVVKRKLKS